MTTQYIDGSYPNGYIVGTHVGTLEIGPAAQIHGAQYGVATTPERTTGVDIDNSGSIYGKTGAGIRLYGSGNISNLGSIASFAGYNNGPVYGGPGVKIDGAGKVTNGSAGDTAAYIGGLSGISISGKGEIVNFGTVMSKDPFSSDEFSSAENTVYIGSGTVINTGDITSGVSIGSIHNIGIGTDAVSNNGTIGAAHYIYNGFPYQWDFSDPGVSIFGDGKVANGEKNHSALIQYGVIIIGGVGTVDNDGTITGIIESEGNVTPAGAYGGSNSLPSISLAGGGLVANGADGDLKAGVVISGGRGNLINLGTIGQNFYFGDSPYGYRSITYPGVRLDSGGTVVNGSATDTGAKIAGGIAIQGGPGSVRNFGSLGYGQEAIKDSHNKTRTTVLYASVSLADGGAVTNGDAEDTVATLSGGASGIAITGGAGAVVNFGVIDTASPAHTFTAGVSLADGGSVTNGSKASQAASISGYDAGVYVTGGAGRITNFGTIGETSLHTVGAAGVQAGVALKDGGSVVNGGPSDGKAAISGVIGVELYGAGAVTNYGSITGTHYAVKLNSASEKLIEEGSGLLTGAVAGDGGLLILDGKAGLGTLTGLGSTISGFAHIDVMAGAAWVLGGTSTVSITNDGRLAVGADGSLTLDSGLQGTGNLALRAGSHAEIEGTVTSGETVQFTGANAQLTLDNPTHFLGAVSNLGGNGTDRLKLPGFGKNTTFTFTTNDSDTGGTLTVTDGAKQAQIALLGQFVATGFHEVVSATYTVFTYTTPSAAIPHIAAPS